MIPHSYNLAVSSDNVIKSLSPTVQVSCTHNFFRDELARGRFWPFVPADHLKPGKKDPNFWYGLAPLTCMIFTNFQDDTKRIYIVQVLEEHIL